MKRVGTPGIAQVAANEKRNGSGQSRHVGRHDDDEDRHHGLELDPVGIASKGRIARLYLKHRQKVPLQSAGNDEDAAKQGELEDQQASVFRSDQA